MGFLWHYKQVVGLWAATGPVLLSSRAGVEALPATGLLGLWFRALFEARRAIEEPKRQAHSSARDAACLLKWGAPPRPRPKRNRL